MDVSNPERTAEPDTVTLELLHSGKVPPGITLRKLHLKVCLLSQKHSNFGNSLEQSRSLPHGFRDVRPTPKFWASQTLRSLALRRPTGVILYLLGHSRSCNAAICSKQKGAPRDPFLELSHFPLTTPSRVVSAPMHVPLGSLVQSLTAFRLPSTKCGQLVQFMRLFQSSTCISP